MTYEQFIAVAIEVGAAQGRVGPDLRAPENQPGWEKPPDPKYPDLRDWCMSASWTTGGVTGGSCWGGTPDTPVSVGREPELTALDSLLEAVAPSIGFLQYKNLLNEVVTYSEKSYSDYYGNSDTTTTKAVELRPLYNALVARKLLDTEPTKE